jgi:hypothetical protein
MIRYNTYQYWTQAEIFDLVRVLQQLNDGEIGETFKRNFIACYMDYSDDKLVLNIHNYRRNYIEEYHLTPKVAGYLNPDDIPNLLIKSAYIEIQTSYCQKLFPS